jgi:hypothetical protein
MSPLGLSSSHGQSRSSAGTNRGLRGFVVMRVQEENCNIVLLATVTLVSAMVAVIAGWWEAPQPAAAGPAVQIANRKVADRAVADRTEVRVIGAPFVPNVNPRDR